MSPMRRMERRDSTPTRSTTCRGWLLLSTATCFISHSNTYMNDRFMIKIETWHKPDMGEQENVHGLDKSTWDATEIVNIDIGDRSCVNQKDYKAEYDPAIFKSERTGRGPLGPDWKKELANNPDCPHMCAYKLVTVEFKQMLVQGKIESFIQKVEQRLFTLFHRQLFCTIDNWVHLTMDDIRRMEEETKKELDEMRQNDEVKGMAAE
uniref:Phosphatidylinositol transfer protein alpha isoform n=1 Tax=Lates calcarifer TaxID=8187 RepID=A0A4W6BP00_LATCA